MKVYIKDIAYYLPTKVVTNEQLVQEFPEWSVEKIVDKVGIKERHVAAEDETAMDMAVSAAEVLFRQGKCQKEEIDFCLKISHSCKDTTSFILSIVIFMSSHIRYGEITGVINSYQVITSDIRCYQHFTRLFITLASPKLLHLGIKKRMSSFCSALDFS